MKKLFVSVLFLLILFAPVAYGRIGVGVGTGKIQVEDKLKPGVIYELPSLTVFNTGDVASDYEVNVTYHEKQPQLRPEVSWLKFSPRTFRLAPGKSQEVKIKLDLPVRTEPGDYFAYVEGHPIAKNTTGTTSVGIAAAAKLYFTIVPGNVFEGIYFKIVSFWNVYAPWPQRAAIALGVIAALLIVKKFFHIQINLKNPKKPNE